MSYTFCHSSYKKQHQYKSQYKHTRLSYFLGAVSYVTIGKKPHDVTCRRPRQKRSRRLKLFRVLPNALMPFNPHSCFCAETSYPSIELIERWSVISALRVRSIMLKLRQTPIHQAQCIHCYIEFSNIHLIAISIRNDYSSSKYHISNKIWSQNHNEW